MNVAKESDGLTDWPKSTKPLFAQLGQFCNSCNWLTKIIAQSIQLHCFICLWTFSSFTFHWRLNFFLQCLSSVWSTPPRGGFRLAVPLFPGWVGIISIISSSISILTCSTSLLLRCSMASLLWRAASNVDLMSPFGLGCAIIVGRVTMIQMIVSIRWFLGPRGPLGTPSFVRLPVRPPARKI